MTRVSAVVALVLVAGPAACGLGPDETAGDLGRGAFRYVCVDASDRICVDGEATEFPDEVATGSRFALDARGLDWWDEAIDGEIVPASDRFAEPIASGGVEGSTFRARTAGTVAMLARRLEDGAIGDLTHMVVVDLTEVDLGCDLDTLVVGESATCRADPLVAGALDFQWTASDPSILAVEPLSETAEAEVRGAGAGTATLRVEVGGVRGEVELRVEPGADSGAGSNAAPDATTEADAGVEADAG